MPYRVRKGKGSKPYKIQRVLPGGGQRQVGSSRSKRKAKQSMGVRVRAEREKRARR